MLHVGAEPPPSSSVNSTFSPSSLIVALCQNAKFSFVVDEMTSGLAGSEMSRITPSATHAPAAMSSSW